jgi:hypothetical protein
MKEKIKNNKELYDFLCRQYANVLILKNGLKADNHALRRFKGIHQGKRCFIIGNGPSLTLEDLSKLKGEYTFASNKIYSVFTQTKWRPTYYVVSDNDITPDMYLQSSNFDSGIKAKFFPSNFRDGCVGKNKNAFFYNYVGCDTTGKIVPKFSDDLSRYLVEGYSVAYVTMQIAVYMGFTEIYLLGLDFSWPVYKDCAGNIYENGQAKHRFYEDNHEADEISIPNVELMENAYRQARKYCEEHDVKIRNVTRGGRLEVFKRASFDDLFAEEK